MKNGNTRRTVLATAALGVVCTAAALPAHADVADMFRRPGSGSGYVESADSRRWDLRDYGHVVLTTAEAKSAANDQPVTLAPAALMASLASVTWTGSDGNENLWEPGELDALVPTLIRALSLAKPTDDVIFVSAAPRHGYWRTPTAVTARAFVSQGALNLIVNDTSLQFIYGLEQLRKEPSFTYGSRLKPSRAVLSGSQATRVRPDWLKFDVAALTAPGEPAGKPEAAAAPKPAPQAVPEAAPGQAAARPAPPPPPPSARPERPAARLSADELEERLTTLKRLHDKGLITDEEFQRKRAALVDPL